MKKYVPSFASKLGDERDAVAKLREVGVRYLGRLFYEDVFVRKHMLSLLYRFAKRESALNWTKGAYVYTSSAIVSKIRT